MVFGGKIKKPLEPLPARGGDSIFGFAGVSEGEERKIRKWKVTRKNRESLYVIMYCIFVCSQRSVNQSKIIAMLSDYYKPKKFLT